MEDSPIVLAHAHARNAVLETRRSNPVAASEEHDLAAAEFAHAAESTTDPEALRTLHLLEQHHKQLGQILRFRHEHSQPPDKLYTADNSQGFNSPKKASDTPLADTANTAKNVSGPEPLQQPPRLAGGTRATARDLSSSIASNLASARGIPGGHRRGPPVSPTISAQHVPGKFAKDQAKSREAQASSKSSKQQPGFFSSNNRSSNDRKPSWAPTTNVKNNEPATVLAPAVESAAPVNDAPFQQFYSKFETLMYKLSAPLAFAGLPLTSSADSTSYSDKQAKAKEPPPPAIEQEPDYSQVISRAALRAVQDGQISSTNPMESFYLVPTTGGTLSYADIMSRADREATALRHAGHVSNVSEDNMEDFVDAKETLSPAVTRTTQDDTDSKPYAPSRSRGAIPRPQQAPHPVSAKSVEELTVTNAALRKLTDTLSKRLHVFEASAQSSSAALAHSIRSISARSNPTTPDDSHGKTPNRDDKSATRIAELEDILKRSDRELARRERENAKLRETVTRYREKWEKLKEGARARRGGEGAGAGAGAGASGVGGMSSKGDDAATVTPSSVE